MAEFKANKYILLPKVSRYTTHKVQIGCFLSVYTSVLSLEEFYDPIKEILVDELKRRVDETPHETSIIFSHQLVHDVFGGFLVHFDRGNTCSFIFLNSALVTKLILGELEWISRHFKPPLNRDQLEWLTLISNEDIASPEYTQLLHCCAVEHKHFFVVSLRSSLHKKLVCFTRRPLVYVTLWNWQLNWKLNNEELKEGFFLSQLLFSYHNCAFYYPIILKGAI